jgi:hypothetical protein
MLPVGVASSSLCCLPMGKHHEIHLQIHLRDEAGATDAIRFVI